MKKLLFGLIATVMVSAGTFAQTFSESAKVTATNAQMVTVVTVAKSLYTRGQSYDGFIQALLIPSPTVPTQDEFFKKVYFYVSNDTPVCDIMKGDNSVLRKFSADLAKSPSNVAKPQPGKPWWQILINIVLNVVVDVVVPFNTYPDFDLWP